MQLTDIETGSKKQEVNCAASRMLRVSLKDVGSLSIRRSSDVLENVIFRLLVLASANVDMKSVDMAFLLNKANKDL